jgi:DnaJ-class molecular chaperone
MADPYTTLGVTRGADEATIKKAYRTLAKELHPDRNRDNPKAAERFSQVTQAYDLLTDKDRRAQYDRGEIDDQGNPKMAYGYGGGGRAGGFRPGMAPGGSQFEFGSDGGDFSDIFEGLFGRTRQASPGNGPFRSARPRAPKGADVAYKLAVEFDEAAALKPQRITLASGRTIDLKLPQGVETGTQMRLAGQGDEAPGGRGDAIVTIEIKPHRFFRRDADDVRLDLPVTLDEAVRGASVKVPTVEGAVMLTVPPGSSSGKVLRLKGRGFHQKGGTRGDQLVTLMIDIPGDDEALRKFVDGWKGAGRNPRGALGV